MKLVSSRFFAVSVAVLVMPASVPVAAYAKISSISPVIAAETQTITITGKGFGSDTPYQGDSNYIAMNDCGQPNKPAYICGPKPNADLWEAGYLPGNNVVGMSISSWIDTQIVIAGFVGSYGSQYSLHNGDWLFFTVFNPQTGKQVGKPCRIKVGKTVAATC